MLASRFGPGKHFAQRFVRELPIGNRNDVADFGRSTSYAHFETKDGLLAEMRRKMFDHIFEGVNKYCVTHPTLAIESLDGKARAGRFEHISEQEEGILLGGDMRIMMRLNACILERPARKETCGPSSRIADHPARSTARSDGSGYPTKLAA